MIDRNRRGLLKGLGGAATAWAAQGLLPVWAQTGSRGLRADLPTLEGPDVRLSVGHSPFTVGGRTGHAVTINGVLPAPLLRLREGRCSVAQIAGELGFETEAAFRRAFKRIHGFGPGLARRAARRTT